MLCDRRYVERVLCDGRYVKGMLCDWWCWVVCVESFM